MGERVTCPRCGRTGVTVTTTGRLRAHRKPNGLTQGDECSASGAPAKRAVHFRHAVRERWSACGYNGNDNTVIITHDITEVTCKFCLGTANKRPPLRPTIKVMECGETGEDELQPAHVLGTPRPAGEAIAQYDELRGEHWCTAPTPRAP